MKTQKFNNIAVSRYLRGEMTQREENEFRKILQDDPDFAAKIALDKLLIKGAALNLHQRPKLVQIPRPVRAAPEPDRIHPLKGAYVWGGFLVALALLGITVFLLMNSKAGPVNTYNKFYHPYMDRSTAMDSKYNMPVEAYENGQYEKAIKGMSNILMFEPENSVAYFYKGLALLAVDRQLDAIQHLSRANALAAYDDKGPILWYLGLAYLRNGDAEDANKVFEELIGFDTLFREKAKLAMEDI